MNYRTCGTECKNLIDEIGTVLKRVYDDHPELRRALEKGYLTSIEDTISFSDNNIELFASSRGMNGRLSCRMKSNDYARKMNSNHKDGRYIIELIDPDERSQETYTEGGDMTLLRCGASHEHSTSEEFMTKLDVFEKMVRDVYNKALDKMGISQEERVYALGKPPVRLYW